MTAPRLLRSVSDRPSLPYGGIRLSAQRRLGGSPYSGSARITRLWITCCAFERPIASGLAQWRTPMGPFRTILFAADFSADSKEAFGLACSLAVETKTRLFVLHVLEPNWVAEEPVYFGQAAVQFFDAGKDEHLHESVTRKLSAHYIPDEAVDVAYQTREGRAADGILLTADEIDSDVIVMGTHGRKGLRSLLAGSVATAVIRGAKCSVLALRSGVCPRRASTFSVILHPTDFSENSRAALDVARSLARDRGARLIVLHVAPFDVYLDGRLATEIDIRDYRHALEAIRQRVDGPDLEYPVETRLTRGFEAEDILQVAREVACDLIVMGTHGRTGLNRLLMGSTAESVVSRADLPVLVVKAFQGLAAVAAAPAAAAITP